MLQMLQFSWREPAVQQDIGKGVRTHYVGVRTAHVEGCHSSSNVGVGKHWEAVVTACHDADQLS
jgi:hypothetical protein